MLSASKVEEIQSSTYYERSLIIQALLNDWLEHHSLIEDLSTEVRDLEMRNQALLAELSDAQHDRDAAIADLNRRDEE